MIHNSDDDKTQPTNKNHTLGDDDGDDVDDDDDCDDDGDDEDEHSTLYLHTTQ